MSDFVYLLPELILAITLIGLVINEISYYGERYRLVAATAGVGFCAAFIQVLLLYRAHSLSIFSGAIRIDGLSLLFKMLFIVIGFLVVALSAYSKDLNLEKRAEFSIFIVAATLFMCLSVSATNLILLFLALQAISLTVFVLAGHAKKSLKSVEAAIKFLVFSVVAIALFLFAASLLFAHTHTLNIEEMKTFFAVQALPLVPRLIVFVFLSAILCFYLGVFPFYLWLPDVLDGAPLPSALFLSAALPVTGIAIFLRLISSVFAQKDPLLGQSLGGLEWKDILATLSGFSMLVGGLLAFRQSGIKRMIACILVVKSGFLLMGLLVLDRVGSAALIYNLMGDVFCTTGLFSSIFFFYHLSGSDQLSQLRETIRRTGLLTIPEAILLLVFFAGLVGLPPFPGYVGHFVLISAVMSAQRYGLVLVAVTATVLCVAAFAKFAFSLMGHFQEAGEKQWSAPTGQRLFLATLVIPLLLLGLFADRILLWASRSLQNILW